ncbi:MAG: D-amino acid dehydrogenase [Magnetovibrionaceae bacterium]
MPTTNTQNIAIIGAGITGITTAYTLLKRGYTVTVFDRNPYAAMETSFANGGQLSASNAEVWNSWPTILKGLKWMFKPGAPLLVRPKPDWHKLSWMAEFMAAIPQYRDNTVSTVRLAIEARQHLRRMAQDEGIDFNCEDRGILHFYRTKAEFDQATKVTALLREGGLERRAVTPAEIKALEPALKGDVYGGFYTESDFTGDIHKFTNGLADACGRLGADLRFGTDVVDVQTVKGGVRIVSKPSDSTGEGSTADEVFGRIVVCSGVMSRGLASRLGDRLNVYPVKGYSITVNLDTEQDQAAAPWTSLLDDHTKLVTSRLGVDRFRVAGTAEFAGNNRDITWDRIQPMIDWCRTHFPGMSTRQCVPWAGLRPMMPNMMPRVGQGRHSRVFYNTGHGHLGWTLSAATAELLANAVDSCEVESEAAVTQPVIKPAIAGQAA